MAMTDHRESLQADPYNAFCGLVERHLWEIDQNIAYGYTLNADTEEANLRALLESNPDLATRYNNDRSGSDIVPIEY